MAESLSSFNQQFDDQLTCNVCLDQYTVPKMLPCHHTFCLECIQRLPITKTNGKDYISCPICRIDHLLPEEGGAIKLPSDFKINSMLEFRQKLHASAAGSTICPKHNQALNVYCETCYHVICRDCTVTEHETHDYHLITQERYPTLYQQLLSNPSYRIKLSTAKFESALKDGSVDLKIVKCLFQGPPRVGKTHLMCLLLQIVVEKLLNSTGCAEHPRRAVRSIGFGAVSREEKWEVINDDVLASLIGQAAAKLNIDHGHQEDESEEENQSGEEKESGDEDKSAGDEDKSGEDEIDAVSQVKSKITSEHLSLLAPAHDQFKELLYFIDSGGQSQFQEVLQAFIPHASLLLLAFKLTEKLSDIPSMVYRSNPQSSHSLGKYALTNEEIITRCARMVYSSGDSVHVALAGTHRDQYSETEHETIEEKDSQLSKVFSFCKDLLLYQNLVDRKLVFPVNGLQAVEGVFDDHVVCQLRSAITSALQFVPTITVPLRWYGLELVLQQHAMTTGEQALSLDLCHKMSTGLKFASEDVPAALEFLSSYNLILYYPKFLPNVVFTTPQVLLDKVTELTECVYALAGGSDVPAHQIPSRGEYLRMLGEGIVSRGILRDYRKHYVPGLFTEKELLLIFEHLYIVAQVDEGHYFMPSLLPHFAPNELQQLSPDLSKPPLLFYFEDGCAPAGLFCALLVCLTSPRIGWKVYLGPPLRGVRSNAACLSIPNTRCLVTIVDALHQFEVHCDLPVGREYHLPKVNEVMTEALEEVIHNRKYTIRFPKKSFFCRTSHPVSSKDPPLPKCHIATPNLLEKELVCFKDPDPRVAGCKMNEVELKWMEGVKPPQSDTASPTIKQLAVELKVEADKWYTLGTLLEVQSWKLAAIAKEEHSCIDRLIKVLEYWQKNSTLANPFTWETVIQALRDIGNNALADQLAVKYVSRTLN